MTLKKSATPEEEYFAREEAAKIQKLACAKQEKLKSDEKIKLKELHWMRCPKCGMELHSILFKGVTIDKCFGCHGVFLDDGELEALAGKESGFISGVLSLFK